MVVLTKNEKILKTYNYCTDNQTHHSLTVTNKRIISMREFEEKRERARSQREVLLQDISSVAGSFSHKTSIAWLVLWILGGITALVGILGLLSVIPTDDSMIFIAPLVLGIILFICGCKAFKNRKATSMMLVLYTNESYNSAIALSCSSSFKRKKAKASEQENSFSVEVDEKIADQLISEIGAYVTAVK